MTKQPSLPSLNDWPAFDDWAYMNEPLYNRVTKEADYLHASNADRYRMLIYAYVTEVNRLRDEYVQYQFENPAPIMGPDGKVWRYIGP